MRAVAVLAAAALFATPSVRAQSRTKVVMLGTGTPNADPDRYGPSVAIVVDGTSYLVDFGVGVVRRAAAAAEKAKILPICTRITRLGSPISSSRRGFSSGVCRSRFLDPTG